jgi:putative DNA primase/helicase
MRNESRPRGFDPSAAPNPVDLVLSMLPDATRSGKGWIAKCPAHDDRKPSLSINTGDDGRTLVKCHAGCTLDAICDALGIGVADLFPAKNAVRGKTGNRRGERCIVAEYDYVNDDGELLFQVVRFAPKDFRQRRPNGNGGFVWNLKGVRRVLYRLPELVGSDPDAWVFVVEGEKDADALADAGLVATTNPGGAGKWKHVDDEALCGRKVCIVADNDAAGRDHANDVAKRLHGRADKVRVLTLPGLLDKGDVSDWLITNDVKSLVTLAESAEPFVPIGPEPDSPDWEPPIPLDMFQLPEFPLEALPDELCALCEFCAQVAESYQVPPDVPALLLLTVGATAFAKRLEVQVQPDWIEQVNIFVAVAMEPGERKSAVFRAVFAPTNEFEREEVERLQPIVDEAAMERSVLEHSLKKAKRDAGEAKKATDRPAASAHAKEIIEELRDMPIIYSPRYVADDATPEALTRLLFEQGGRVALLSPEGDTFDLMAGRYSASGAPNLGVYLKGHAGDDIRVDRVNKDRPPEHIVKPALTIGLAVQPDVLRGLADKPGFRGRGLLARFLFALPSSRIGRRQTQPRRISPKTTEQCATLIRAAMRFGNPIDARTTRLRTITIHADAEIELDRFRESVEREMRDGARLAPIKDWAAKLPGAVCRIAGILHGFIHVSKGDPDAHPINQETMLGAIAIGEYLIEHALATFHLIGADPVVASARRLLKWITGEQLTEFTRRDAFNRIRSAGDRVGIVDAPLELLIEHDYIRERETNHVGPGRKPSTTYIVNPYALPQNAHNTQNRSASGNSADSAHEGSE